MSDTPYPREKRKRDIAHKELREMVENVIMFVGLSLLLPWASDHVHNLAAGVALKVAAGLAFFVGVLLRMACVLTSAKTMEQITKECPILKGRVYGLCVTGVFAVLIFGGILDLIEKNPGENDLVYE